MAKTTDPENISISDFSEEGNSTFNEEKFDESSSHGSFHNDGASKLYKESENKSNCYFVKHDGLPKSGEKNNKNKKVVELDAKLSQKKLFVKSSSSMVTESENNMKVQDLLIHKVLAKTKKKLENIMFPDESSCSSFISADSKHVKDFSMKCPPLPLMTNALMKHYSLPFKDRPTLIKFVPNMDEIPHLKEEELRKICSKKKVSFPTVYRKLVAPILWGVTNNKMPYCLKDLPIQAYSQQRFNNKLEKTLKIIQQERRKEMVMRENIGAKQPRRTSSYTKVLTA